MALRGTAAAADPDLMFLPWHLPLEEWPEESTIALPRGISRHIVRFSRINGVVYAIKETQPHTARHEYTLLVELRRDGLPTVEPVGIVEGRESLDGEELPAALLTRHLKFSLPYRALFSQTLQPETTGRLLDALAVLLVRLHLEGFAWNDCSLSNVLFRRDASEFSAYLVDAETGERREMLSTGQRGYDLDTAQLNVAGELMDLQAGGKLDPSIDPADFAVEMRARYDRLWDAVTAPMTIGPDERYKLHGRIAHLNELGFDVAEVDLQGAERGRLIITPKVVDSGHHSRRLLRLTGLDVQENQARRLLNDLDGFRATRDPDEDEEVVAHRWLTEVFEPVVRAVPGDLRSKLEPAQIFHELLEHRWFLSERTGTHVDLDGAVLDYIDTELRHRPDEAAVLGRRIGTPSPSDAGTVFTDETMEMDLDEIRALEEAEAAEAEDAAEEFDDTILRRPPWMR